MRYLVYMPQPEDGQLVMVVVVVEDGQLVMVVVVVEDGQLARRPRLVARRCGAPGRESSVACRLQAPLEEATVRMQLNLCAAKLRTGREAAALAHADKVLELRPEHPKALYRKGQASGGTAPAPLGTRGRLTGGCLSSRQAHTQLGAYAEASLALTRAKAAAEAEADSSAAAAVEKEEARLAERRQRHARQRKAAYRRMVGGGGAGEARGEANAEAADQPRAAAGGGLRVGVAAAVLVAAGAVALAAAALASSWGGAEDLQP